MTLQEQIYQDVVAAMKAKDSAMLSTLRMLKSAVKNKQIDVQHELDDAEVQAVVKSQIKQLSDAMQMYVDGGRTQDVQHAKQEIALLEKYLPAQMAEEELTAIVKEAVVASGAKSKADAGRAMGAAMKAVAGRADGNRVKAIVEGLLAAFVLMAIVVEPAHAAIIPSEAFSSGSGAVVFLARLLRVLLLIFGMVSINLVLVGAFKYMVASGTDSEHTAALRNITMGFFGTFVVIALFSAATFVIQSA